MGGEVLQDLTKSGAKGVSGGDHFRSPSSFMRNKVVHYRLIRKGTKFELKQIRRPMRRGFLLCEQRCRRCGAVIKLWASRKLTIVLAQQERKCCGGMLTITVALKQNYNITGDNDAGT